MLRRLPTVVAFAVMLVATVAGAGLAPAPAAAGAPQIRIALDCDGTPEKTSITNISGKEVTIESVGSLFDRTNREPFNVNETLKPGQSITLESGEDARGGDRLTGQELYDDESNRDGAKVHTSIGTFKERC